MAIQMEGHNAEYPVDFDEAITAAGIGKFQHKIILAGGFSLLCSYIAISGISFILPASQCDLNMNSQDKGYLISAGFLGIALSCHLWGFLSDTLGRHFILSRCLLVDGLLYIITSLTPNYSLILIWRFFNGFASCGGIVSLYAYVGEFHSNKTRLRALMITSLLASLIYFLLPAFAWLVIPGKWSFVLYPGLVYKPWRLYYACNGVPSLICSFMLYFLPESPKFLLAKGEKEKALQVLQRIHKENSKKDEQEKFWIKNIVLNESEKAAKPIDNTNKVIAFFSLMWNQTIPLFQSPHRFCMVLVCLTQYLLYMSNGGIYLWLPEILNRLAVFKNDYGDKPATYCEVVQYRKQIMQIYVADETDLLIASNDAAIQNSYVNYNNSNQFLPDGVQQHPVCIDDIDFSVYLHLEVLGLCSASTLAVCVILCSFFDKKYILEFCVIISLICAVCLLAVNITQIIPIASTIIIVSSGAAIPIINSLAVDLFPTNLRAMASCFTLMCSRLGTVTANTLAGSFIDSYCNVLIWSFIISFIVSIILIVLIPNKPSYLKEKTAIKESI